MLLNRLYMLAKALASLVSRAGNVVLLGGSPDQTISSRTYIMRNHSRAWNKLYHTINTVFFLQEDHCLSAWQFEVDSALRTLELNSNQD